MRRVALLYKAISDGCLPCAKGVFPIGPNCGTESQFVIVEQAGVESSFDFLAAQIDPDEDQLLHTVAVRLKPEVGQGAEAGFILGPFFFGECGVPEALGLGIDAVAGLGVDADNVVFSGQPEKAFGAEYAGEDFAEGIPETLGMKGTAGTVDKTGDAVFFGFGGVEALEFFEPAGHDGGLFFVVEAGVEDQGWRNAGMICLEDFRIGVDLEQQLFKTNDVLGAHTIDLVDDQDIGELHLIDQQVGNVARVFVAEA